MRIGFGNVRSSCRVGACTPLATKVMKCNSDIVVQEVTLPDQGRYEKGSYIFYHKQDYEGVFFGVY
jgi:hypothetical protein